MSWDESDLIKRAKERDPDAFSQLYLKFYPLIYRYILYRVQNVTTAEDLTSEVFCRLVEKIDQFHSRGRTILAWLYTIARNLVTDYRRQAKRLAPFPVDERLTTPTPQPEEEAQAIREQYRLAAALDYLTEDQRLVILLKFIEGMDNATVAQIMNKSVGAVKALQYRALTALRKHLRE